MSSTGAKAPGTATTTAEAPWSDDAWTNVANIYGAGEASVTATSFDAGDQTEVLKAFNFDFTALSTTATIQGLTCTINARYATDVASIDLVQALDTTRAKVGTNMAASATALGTAAADYTFGGATNTWGNALTPAWLKDADFGVAVGCIAGGSGNNNVDVYIDTVTINVYYTELVTADTGSFTLGGQDASPKAGRKLTADTGSCAVTGNAAALSKGMRFAADAGSYACAGNDAAMKVTRKLPADAGSYAQSGQDASLKTGYKITAAAGSYSCSGNAATLTYTPSSTAHWTLSASSYITASGEDTTAQLTPPAGKTVTDFQAGRIADDENPLDAINLTSGKYTELEWSIKPTSQAARAEVWEFRVTVAGTPLTTYTVTPTVTLTNAYSMTADPGSYGQTGQDAALKVARKVTAEAGSYTYTGNAAALSYVHADYILTADSGTYAISGQDAALKADRKAAADAGVYNISGSSASLLASHTMTAGSGAYTTTGTSANLYHGYSFSALIGAYNLTGNAAAFLRTYHADAGQGQYTYTGSAADLTYRVLHEPTAWRVYPEREAIEADARQTVKAKRSAIETDIYRRK